MAILQKAIYRFNPHQNAKAIFNRNTKMHPKIHMEMQKIPNSQSNPEQQT
jgi:hypothetical protein